MWCVEVTRAVGSQVTACRATAHTANHTLGLDLTRLDQPPHGYLPPDRRMKIAVQDQSRAILFTDQLPGDYQADRKMKTVARDKSEAILFTDRYTTSKNRKKSVSSEYNPPTATTQRDNPRGLITFLLIFRYIFRDETVFSQTATGQERKIIKSLQIQTKY